MESMYAQYLVAVAVRLFGLVVVRAVPVRVAQPRLRDRALLLEGWDDLVGP